jgi:hypothetical protein
MLREIFASDKTVLIGRVLLSNWMTLSFEPDRNRSMRAHGVRRPVISTAALIPTAKENQGQVLEIKTGRRDVTQFVRRDVVAAVDLEKLEQFAWNEMYLPKVS